MTTDLSKLAASLTDAQIASLSQSVRGWRTLGLRKSNGETMCAGCWDRSDHDTEADHDIPVGQPVWWSTPNPEYGDCDAYCTQCVIEDAECNEVISAELASSLRAYLERNPEQ